MDGTLLQEVRQIERYYEQYDTSAFFTHIDDVLQKLLESKSYGAYITLMLHKATLYFQLSNYSLASHTLTDVAPIVQGKGSASEKINYYTTLAALQQANHQHGDAFTSLQLAERHAQEEAQHAMLPLIYHYMSNHYEQQSEKEEGLRYATKAKAACTNTTDAHVVWQIQTSLANAYIQTNRLREAEVLLQQLEQQTHTQKDSIYYTSYVSVQAKWLVANNRQREADELLRKQLKFVRTAALQQRIYEQLCPIAKQVHTKEHYVRDLRYYYELIQKAEQEERNEQVAAIADYFNEEAVQSAAWVDSLTHVYNRKFLEENIEQWTTKHSAFTIAIFDIDKFKAINDTYGHLVGDEVIQLLASTAVDVLGSESLVIRYGGDEFILLWPHNERAEIEAALQQLQQAIAKLFVMHEDKRITFTISLGVDLFAMPTSKVDVLMKQADEALYKAKQNGRKQYVIV